MLSVRIQKRLNAFSLDVDFEAEGETLALLGPSGCGKSMTLKCIAGIVRPDSGRIVLDGRVLFDSEKHINLSPQERHVGYLFQQYALFPNMTVRQNIECGIKDRKARRALSGHYMERMQLTEFADKRPHELSGGQQQRVALARILASEPALMLLDEPFSALDSYLRWQLELELSDTLSGYGGTAILVSHSRDEVYRLCDSVCVLTNGKTEPKTSVRELFDEPASRTACLLSGCKNFSAARRVDARHVEATEWGAIFTVAKDVPLDIKYIGIRAHYIRICPDGSGADNRMRCTVDRVIEDVFSTIIMLRTPGGGLIRMELDKGSAAFTPGQTLEVCTAPESVMLLSR